MPVSGSTITKPFILLHLTIIWGGLQFRSGITSLPTSIVVRHIIWLFCSADSGLISSVPCEDRVNTPDGLLTGQKKILATSSKTIQSTKYMSMSGGDSRAETHHHIESVAVFCTDAPKSARMGYNLTL